MRLAIVLVVILAIPALAQSATLFVPGQYPTIQQAIDASVNGDTVQVSPGTYMENIDFKGKAITVTSEQVADVTAIDGNKAGSVVTCQTNEDENSVLDGFTITNGTGTYVGGYVYGGGMYNLNSSPTVTNCTFSGNSAPHYGGGMYNLNSSPTVTNCTFSGNSTGFSGYGGGMGNDSSNPTVTNCTFFRNTACVGGGMGNDSSSPTVTNCTFFGNATNMWGGGGGGGMYNIFSNPTVTNCTFFRNDGAWGGGGMYNYDSSPMVTNCIFSGNWAGGGGGMLITGGSSTVANCILWDNSPDEIYGTTTVSYSDVKGGYSGTGNIDSDPVFVTGPCGFYYLSQIAAGQPIDSPCVDTGAGPASNYGMDIYWTRTDGVPDSGIVDMGFHYGDFIFPSLQTDTFTILESAGGDADFLLLAGTGNANRNYILLGSVTGIFYGIPLPGGHATLPLNWDVFTNVVVDMINTPIFSNFMGTLNGTGSAMAKFDTLAPIPGTAGLTMYFAYALNNPWDFVSNWVGIEIVP